MYRYLLRQSLRALRVQTKNFILVILGLIVVGTFFLRSVFTTIRESDFSLSNHLFAIGIIIAAFQLLVMLFRKVLVFAMHPASIHFFFNTEKLKEAQIILVAKKVMTNAFFSVAIALIIYNFHMSADFFRAMLVLLTYFMIGSFGRWMVYLKQSAAIITEFYILSATLFVAALSIASVIPTLALFLVLVVIVYFNLRIKIDWGKYYDDCVYANKINHASRHMNMAEMQQITAEHIANKDHGIKIYSLPLNHKNALFCKAAIETLRMSKQVMVVLALFLALSVLLVKTNVFRDVPLIGDPNISSVIAMLAIGTFFANIREIYLKQIASISSKNRQGFFIPYSFGKIVFSYAIICCFITTFVTVALCFVFAPALLNSVILLAAFNLVMVLSFTLQSRERLTHPITMITNLVLFLAARLLFG